jgi:hypothetical protein
MLRLMKAQRVSEPQKVWSRPRKNGRHASSRSPAAAAPSLSPGRPEAGARSSNPIPAKG